MNKQSLEEVRARIKDLSSNIGRLKEELLESEVWLSIKKVEEEINQLKVQESKLLEASIWNQLKSLYEVRTGYEVISLYMSGDGEDDEMKDEFSHVLVLKGTPALIEVHCWFESNGDERCLFLWEEGPNTLSHRDERVLGTGSNEADLLKYGYWCLKRGNEEIKTYDLSLMNFTRTVKDVMED